MNSKGEDEEMNLYLESLYYAINEPRFYLKEIDINGKILNDWIKYGLIEEAADKGKWRKFSFKEAIWLKFIEELRFFGTPLKTIKNIKETIYDKNDHLTSDAIEFYKKDATTNNTSKKIIENYERIKELVNGEQREKIAIFMNPLNTCIVYTLLGSLNPIFIYNEETEGFYDIGGLTEFFGESESKKEQFEKAIFNRSFVSISLKSLISKFFKSDKNNADLNFYFGLMNIKERELITKIRSANFSKITLNLEDGKIVLTKAQKANNEAFLKQIAKIIKRGDFIDLEISARDGKIIKLNEIEVTK